MELKLSGVISIHTAKLNTKEKRVINTDAQSVQRPLRRTLERAIISGQYILMKEE